MIDSEAKIQIKKTEWTWTVKEKKKMIQKKKSYGLGTSLFFMKIKP